MFMYILVLAVWCFGLGNLFVGYVGIWGTIASWVLGLLIVSHVAETLFVLNRIKQSPEPLWRNVIKSLVFGHAFNRRFL